MCVVCELNGWDYRYLNGKKNKLSVNKLYTFFDQKRAAQFKLCHIHSIELFKVGESSFLKTYEELGPYLRLNNHKYAVSS